VNRDIQNRASIYPPIDYGTWREKVARELDGRDPDEALATDLVGGPTVRPLYTRELCREIGCVPMPNRIDSAWWIGQDYASENLDALAGMVEEDLTGGVDGFSIDLDPMVCGLERVEASKGGSCNSRSTTIGRGLERLFARSRTFPVFLLLESSLPPEEVAAGALQWLDRSQCESELRLGLGIDPLRQAARRGQLPAPEAELGALMRQGFELGDSHPAAIRVLSVSTSVYFDAGADAAYEMALALATAVDYVRRLDGQGIDASRSAAKIVFRFAIGKDFFSEIAKLRAFRILWTRLAAKTFALEASEPLWIHGETATRSLTAWDVSTNLLRGTNSALAAVLGGADSIAATPYDYLHHRDSSRGRRLARNTQHILKEESFLGRVDDPTAGSYYVESLTSDLTRRAWSRFQDIERSGGMLPALMSGEVQRSLKRLWGERSRRFADRSEPITGISFFAEPNQDGPPLSGRTPSPSEVLSPFFWWSDSKTAPSLPPVRPHRDSEDFEALRERAERLAGASGHPLMVSLLPIPNRAKARDTIAFARNLFSAGGFEVEIFQETDEGGSLEYRPGSAASSVVCICAGPDADLEQIDRCALASRQAGASVVMATLTEALASASHRCEHLDTTLAPGVDAVKALGALVDRISPSESTKES